jgi:excisionase family DNA binding protein
LLGLLRRSHIRERKGRMKLLSLKETAEVLGLKPSTLYAWHSKGTLPLPVIRIGGKLLFDIRDIDRLIEMRRERPQSDPLRIWK